MFVCNERYSGELWCPDKNVSEGAATRLRDLTCGSVNSLGFPSVSPLRCLRTRRGRPDTFLALSAANLLYKIIDARSRQRSTALVTNIDFAAWGDYLGDPPLAMAFLDRVVDGAIIVKINGKSYRAHRASTAKATSNGKR